NLSGEKMDAGVTDFHELAVKDLKLNQLRLLHLDHHKAPENRDKLRVTGDPQEAEELEPFPTLVEALKNVDMDTGFNIEVKYPLKMKDGAHECENFFERNAFIDVILNDVYANAGKRRIVFSSFDPDMCTLIALKQHKYPVLFLSVGETKRYVPFLDERTCTSNMAVNFAVSQDILGVNLHSECLLIDPLPVRKAKEQGLVAFVWGDDLDDRENVKKMKELGLDGIIYDRIGEIEARKNVFIVEKDARKSLFASSPIPSRSGSVDKGAYIFGTMDIAIPTRNNGVNNVGSGSSSSSTTNTPRRARTPSSPKRTGRFNEI
uniref:GP-PDE domain-containing protein n=2 Tax=Panagrolaimus sp. JU765 TaxID=591449 RepID=A0AC34RJJ2_9BILA